MRLILVQGVFVNVELITFISHWWEAADLCVCRYLNYRRILPLRVLHYNATDIRNVCKRAEITHYSHEFAALSESTSF